MASSPLAAALLGENNAAAFTDPNIAAAMPDIQLGQALIQGGMSTAPAYPMQALARVAQTAAGNYLERSAVSDLAKIYAHSADAAADTLPDSALKTALKSQDPFVRMQAMQAYQKGLTLLAQPENLPPGHELRLPGGGAPLAANTQPRAPDTILQQDLSRMQPANAGVPLNPPRLGPPIQGNGGMGPNGETITGAYRAGPAPAQSPPIQPRPVPTQSLKPPLQDVIDYNARKAAAEKAAEVPAAAAKAGAEETARNQANFGGLLNPSAPPSPGPGGTEPLPTQHGTKIPPLTDQAPIPTNPEELKQRLPAWQKTSQDWNASLQPSYQAEQRLNTIANAFKQIQTGAFTTNKAQFATWLKSAGLDSVADKVMQGADPAQVQLALHENYAETMQQLKAATSRFTQQEFKITAENKEHPNLQPEANLQMLAEDIGALRQARDLPRDFVIAQQHGWKDPQSYEQAWLRQNPLSGYVDTAKKEIGPLKGMVGNEKGTQPAFPGGNPQTPTAPRVNDKAGYDALPKGAPYMAPDGTIRHKQ